MLIDSLKHATEINMIKNSKQNFPRPTIGRGKGHLRVGFSPRCTVGKNPATCAKGEALVEHAEQFFVSRFRRSASNDLN